MLSQKMSIKQIAKIFNVQEVTIYSNIKRWKLNNYINCVKPYRQLSDEDLVKIKQLRYSGMIIKDIAKEMNVNPSTVVRALNKVCKSKIVSKPGPRPIDQNEIDKIITLRKNGLYLAQIAAQTGYSKTTVLKYIHLYDDAKRKED